MNMQSHSNFINYFGSANELQNKRRTDTLFTKNSSRLINQEIIDFDLESLSLGDDVTDLAELQNNFCLNDSEIDPHP